MKMRLAKIFYALASRIAAQLPQNSFEVHYMCVCCGGVTQLKMPMSHVLGGPGLVTLSYFGKPTGPAIPN